MSRPSRHLAASVVLGLGQWARTGSVLAGAAVLVSGFAIDFDHFVDLGVHRLRPGRNRLLVLPAHGWEYVPLLLLAEARWGWRWTASLSL